MAKKKGNGYNANTGAFGGLTNSQLQNITLPKKVQCDFCKKQKGPQAYSSVQLAKIRTAIHVQGYESAVFQVRCIPCTGGQRSEMRCCDCGEDKGLEYFTKAQRKTPDEAICEECKAPRLEFQPRDIREDPVAESDDESDSESECSEETDDEYAESDDGLTSVTTSTIGGTSSINSGLNSLSINESTNSSITGSRYTASYFSGIHIGRESSGGVTLNGSQASTAVRSYGVPRSRGVAQSTASSSVSSAFPRTRTDDSQRADSDAESTVCNESDESESDENDYDTDDEGDEDDDEDDDPYNGQWRDGNIAGY